MSLSQTLLISGIVPGAAGIVASYMGIRNMRSLRTKGGPDIGEAVERSRTEQVELKVAVQGHFIDDKLAFSEQREQNVSIMARLDAQDRRADKVALSLERAATRVADALNLQADRLSNKVESDAEKVATRVQTEAEKVKAHLTEQEKK
jgi:hypothetical protein